jgi:hypothetical protein
VKLAGRLPSGMALLGIAENDRDRYLCIAADPAVGTALHNGYLDAINANIEARDRKEKRAALKAIDALPYAAWRLLVTPEYEATWRKYARPGIEKEIRRPGRRGDKWKGPLRRALKRLGVEPAAVASAVKVVAYSAQQLLIRNPSGFGMLSGKRKVPH